MEDVRGMEDIHNISRSQSYLAYMNFAHVQVTGARFGTVSPDFDGIPENASIIAACLREAYKLGQEEDEACDMSSYNYVKIPCI